MSQLIQSFEFTKPTGSTAAVVSSVVHHRIDIILNSQDKAAKTSNITINSYVWYLYTSANPEVYLCASDYNPKFELYLGSSIVHTKGGGTAAANRVRIWETATSKGYNSWWYAANPKHEQLINSYTTTVQHDVNGEYSNTVKLKFTPAQSSSSTVIKYNAADFTSTVYTFELPQIKSSVPDVYDGNSWKDGDKGWVHDGTEFKEIDKMWVHDGTEFKEVA